MEVCDGDWWDKRAKRNFRWNAIAEISRLQTFLRRNSCFLSKTFQDSPLFHMGSQMQVAMYPPK